MSPEREDIILSTLRDFRREVRDEFKVVKAKQDLTNGRVNILESERDRREGYDQRRVEEDADRRWWLQLLTSPLTGVVLFVAGVVTTLILGPS